MTVRRRSPLDHHGDTVEALPLVRMTERQIDLHTRWKDQHPASSSRWAMYCQTASGSLPGGANTRRPSASSTATAHEGICWTFCSTRPPPALQMLRSSAIRRATRLALLILLKPGGARHRNSMLGRSHDRGRPAKLPPRASRFRAGVLLSVVKLRSRARPDGLPRLMPSTPARR